MISPEWRRRVRALARRDAQIALEETLARASHRRELSSAERELGRALRHPITERVQMRVGKSADVEPVVESREVVVERIAQWLYRHDPGYREPWSETDDFWRNAFRMKASDLLREARVPLLRPVTADEELDNDW